MPAKLPVYAGRFALSYRIFYLLLWAAIVYPLNATSVQAADSTLTLSDAMSRAMAQNPRLQVFDLRLDRLQGRRITANLNPALEVGAEVENFLGTADARGLVGAELTLTLSSTLELGGQRQARVSAVDSRRELVEAERRADTLDLLGQVTQRFVATLALQEKLQLAADAVSLTQSTLDIVTRRANQGATSQAEVLRARAALTQSQIEQSRLQSELVSRKMALALLWGDTTVEFGQLQGDLFQFGSSDSFESLFQRVSDSPAIQVYASEQRVREAEIQLARSQSESDIGWQVGVRRREDTDDFAFTAGFSVPLFPVQRNRGEVRAARAARDEVRFRRETTLLNLHSYLFDAYQQRQQSIAAVERIRNEMLPDLSEALTRTREAYESGRYSYVEWMAAQRELLAAQRALVDTAATALLNQAMIEQLTAQPLAGR
jgi:cobalt-zinc-cadmium efflux system outer membrane protein